MICSRVGLPSRRVTAANMPSCAVRNGREDLTRRAQQCVHDALKTPTVMVDVQDKRLV